jgi:hypothetical protein
MVTMHPNASLYVFVGMNLYLLFRNETAIESLEFKGFVNSDGDVRALKRNIWSKGWRRNFSEVMGEGRWWWVPLVDYRSVSDGYYWEVDHDLLLVSV